MWLVIERHGAGVESGQEREHRAPLRLAPAVEADRGEAFQKEDLLPVRAGDRAVEARGRHAIRGEVPVVRRLRLALPREPLHERRGLARPTGRRRVAEGRDEFITAEARVAFDRLT